jgi:hypothetical protein
MDNSEHPRSPGTTCTCRAWALSMGKSSSASCVEVMMPPSAVWMRMGFCVGRLLMTGYNVLTYVSVQAESGVRMGGPLYDKKAHPILGSVLLLSLRGSPRRHSLKFTRRRAVSVVVFLSPNVMRALPPMRLSKVVSSLWPSSLLVHVIPVCFGLRLRPCVQQ